MPSEEVGKYKFRDFDRDDRQMASLFEAFIRNFYKLETSFRVGRDDIQWLLKSESDDAARYLPKMQTDATLSSGTRKIIIEAKYYRETLQYNFDVEKIHSANLYQLFAYIKNIEVKDNLSRRCEGMLLYPVVGQELKLDYSIDAHKIKVRTINLNQNWKQIHNDLLSFVN